MMVTLGTDAHKRSHTIVATDDVGAEIGSVTVQATPQVRSHRCAVGGKGGAARTGPAGGSTRWPVA